MQKRLAMIGLGKMGAGLARNMMDKGWEVVGYNRTTAVAEEMAKEGLKVAKTYQEVIEALPSPRIIWLMLPAGKPIDEALFGKQGIAALLKKGDIVVEGGNSFYKDDKPRYLKLKKRGIRYLDVGVSGGPKGAREGACCMIGGDKDVFSALEPLFKDISREDGYAFFQGVGAGHFVKMVHNGIEYGMMQAIAEGFAIMKKSAYKLDLNKVVDIYQHGSVIESRLVQWMGDGFKAFGQNLKGVSGSVGYTGEGEWTVKTAKSLKVPAPIIEGSFRYRVASKKKPTYTGQLLSAMRNMFGGHAFSGDAKKRGKK